VCAQVNQAFCGVATMATILNAMNFPRQNRPLSLMMGAGNSYFDQKNVRQRIIIYAFTIRDGSFPY
jgi:hypothetical protein